MEINELLEIDREAQIALQDEFKKCENIAYYNTSKVVKAFNEYKVSEAMLNGTTGYGYGDIGRDTLDKIYARAFGCESAICRLQIVNGTHAIAIGLYGLLRPGDVMLSITGKPYDTLNEVIGWNDNNNNGSLKNFGIKYDEIPLDNGYVDVNAVKRKISEYGDNLKVIFIQRSKGYLDRPTYSAEYIGEIAKFCHSISKAYVVVDNCYGEFCDEKEPVECGADLQMGSLIKNPGGGIAKTGGYLAGTKECVELASYRLTTVGIGGECGASLNENRDMYRGFFLAPHVVCQAKKTMIYAAYLFERLGYNPKPRWNEERHDIIQSIQLDSKENLVSFCEGIQSSSPVESYVRPEPWDMPGYNDQVIMAAGTFISGASIELSADGPIKKPYLVYIQGGLTYESGRYSILETAKNIINKNN